MNRRLLVIANTGPEDDYCAGVCCDFNNYLSFFKSPEGGLWDNHEIIPSVINNWNERDVIEVIQAKKESDIDYWLIVFIGHGRSANCGDVELCLSPTSSSTILLSCFKKYLCNSRCLFIADCCRGKESLNESCLPSINFSNRKKVDDDYYYMSRCRELYNNKIMQLHTGFFEVGFAASDKQYASDRFQGDGGLYSYHLLMTAKELIEKQNANADRIIGFSYVHSIARQKVIKESKYEQIPQLKTERGYQPPFCVIPQGNHCSCQ